MLTYIYLHNCVYSIKYPGHLPGTGPIEGAVSKTSHLALYGFMTIMPVTGIAMGLYGGKGLPFFWTTIPGFNKKNGKLAGQVRAENGTIVSKIFAIEYDKYCACRSSLIASTLLNIEDGTLTLETCCY